MTVEEVKILAQYELMYILRPDLGEEQLTQDIERFNEVIAREGGEVEKTEKWGRRKLAYEINDLNEGFYVVVSFRGQGTISNELDRVLKIHDDVVRSMTVRMDE